MSGVLELGKLVNAIERGEHDLSRHYKAEEDIERLAAKYYEPCMDYRDLMSYFESVRNFLAEYLLPSE